MGSEMCIRDSTHTHTHTHTHTQYYQDANEADVWMNDKAGIAANQDYGRDEDAAVKALKKHKVRCQLYTRNGC